jgi:foldase protein PrsA
MEDFLYDIYGIEKEGNQLEDYYQKNLGFSYWDYEYQGSTMRDAARSSILTQVVMDEILSREAKKNGMTLTNQELTNIDTQINDFTEPSTQDMLDSIGLTRKVLDRALTKKALSDIYYQELTKDFRIDETSIRNGLSKEDYREYKTECIYVPTVSGSGKSLSALNQEDMKVAFNTISAVWKELVNGSGFDVLLNKYGKLKYETRNFIKGNTVYEKEYQTAAKLLKNDEYSKIITTKSGYYIIHMLDNNSSDQYEQAVEDAVNSEKDKQFSEVYKTIRKQYDITINHEYWDKIKIGSITTAKDKE